MTPKYRTPNDCKTISDWLEGPFEFPMHERIFMTLALVLGFTIGWVLK